MPRQVICVIYTPPSSSTSSSSSRPRVVALGARKNPSLGTSQPFVDASSDSISPTLGAISRVSRGERRVFSSTLWCFSSAEYPIDTPPIASDCQRLDRRENERLSQSATAAVPDPSHLNPVLPIVSMAARKLSVSALSLRPANETRRSRRNGQLRHRRGAGHGSSSSSTAVITAVTES